VSQFVRSHAAEQHGDICSCRLRHPHDVIEVDGRQHATAGASSDEGLAECARLILVNGSFFQDAQ
jgi:hypothetical protein